MQTAASAQPMYRERRQAIRETYLPILSALHGAEHAFVVGTPSDGSTLQAIRQEEEEQGGPFFVLDTEVTVAHACKLL